MINLKEIDNLINSLKHELDAGVDTSLLRVKYLGKKSDISVALALLSAMSSEDKKKYGAKLNRIKNEIFAMLKSKADKSDTEDFSLPISLEAHGHYHPTDFVINRIYSIMSSIGFKILTTPEIETEVNNFDSLLVAKDHPARDMQDTFWTKNNMVLRTQTTAFQSSVLKQFKPPFAVMQAGKVYRAESEDATHLSELHMIDAFAVGKDLNFTNLKGVLFHLVSELLNRRVELRFRPSFFPFVEPGAEMDIICDHCNGKGCRSCGGDGWLELVGCGMTHPDILNNAGLDPNIYHGIAFGLGIERITMKLFEINDIRELSRNNPEFLEQLA